MKFPVFSILPDFKELPQKKVLATIELLALSPAEAFLSFPTLKDDLTVIYNFAAKSEAERDALLGFWEQMGARKGWFLMPSWERDFSIGAHAQGDTELILNANILPTPSTPDEPGAWIYIYENEQFFYAEVLKKTGAAYYLDRPLTFTPTNAAICGWMRVARFDNDDISPRWLDAEHMYLELGVTFARIANKATRTLAIDDAAARYWLQPLTLKQEPQIELRKRFDYCTALGPAVYGQSNLQATTVSEDTEYERPGTQWTAWIKNDGVYFGKVQNFNIWNAEAYNGQKSLLPRFTPKKYDHLAFCFDEQGKEVLAFEYDGRTILYGYDGAEPFKFAFDGISPQLIQSWCLQNEGMDRSDAEVICVYLKEGDAAIYFRSELEGFEIERVLCGLYGMPAKIESVEIVGDKTRVIMRDDGFRKMTAEFNFPYSTVPNVPGSIYYRESLEVIYNTTLLETLVGVTIHPTTTIESHRTFYDEDTVFNTETTTYQTTYVQFLTSGESGTLIATTDGNGNATVLTVTDGTFELTGKTTVQTVIIVMPTTRVTAKNRVTLVTVVENEEENVYAATEEIEQTIVTHEVTDYVLSTYRTTHE